MWLKEETDIQYYTFTIDGQRVGYFEVDERPERIYMNAKMVVGGARQENPFTLQLEDGRATHVRLGDGDWQRVPERAYPTSAYLLVLRAGLPRYRAFIEGTGEIEDRTIRSEEGLLVEYANARIVRKFQIERGQVVYISWGGTAESHLVGSKKEAVWGTVYER